ncbi:MAG: helix-turn-helix domain-containing protein [Gemmataceae bacterium]
MIEGMLNADEKGMYARVVGAAERELVTRVLKHTRGHLGRACERLGIDRKTPRNKLCELGVTPDKAAVDRADSLED